MSRSSVHPRRSRSIAAAALVAAAAAAAAAAVSSSTAYAQVTTLGKGHTYFVNNGLQVWGLDQGANQFNYANMANANFNGVMWSWGQAGKVSQLTAGQKWGKWTDPGGNPALALDAIETAKMADLIALQVGDEQQTDLEDGNVTRTWFQNAHAGNYFPNQLLYVNSFYINSDANYANFIASANPDAISFDSYPFDEPYGSVILPQNWLALAGRFRRHALSSYIGTGSNAPRPYGLYLQTYEASEGPGRATRHPGDVEMRWQQFTAWTMGFSFVDAFTVGGSSSLFNNSNQNDISQPRYDQFKESARQSRNLGPTLTKLISYGYGPSIVLGSGSGTAGVPSDWLPFDRTNAPANQRYLTSLSAANTGTKNGGLPGDIYVGFFNPLHASFGESGDAYFMVTNALGAYLNDPAATVADCQQQITMNFDSQYSGISTLQRLRRSDGQLEIVPLTRTTARQYQLQFALEGGTGDLFKYNDGSPFVGFNNRLDWDNDGAGAGTGGTGTWDAASNKWHNGSSHGPWVGNRDAVFAGSAGTVTLAAPQSVNSLSFKSNGYQLTGSTLTMAGQFVTTDAGVSSTIGSVVAGSGGVVKAGAGTLVLSNAGNTYSGGAAVTGGVLQIGADGALGAAPASFTAGNVILNGGTLRFGANLDINNNRGIFIGPAGGTIDTSGFSNSSGYTQANGIFGTGNLTKIGTGTFFMNTPAGQLNTGWTGNLIIKEGTWKITERGGLPYNANADSIYRPGQVTLDGGTWQIAANISVSSMYRGITIAAGGGTIDTQSFNLTWGGPVIGNVPAATLTKIGSGTLTLNSASATGPATYSGNVNVNAGTLVLGGGTAMGDSASINLANAAGATLNVTGNETIGSLSGGGLAGGNVTVGAGATLTTGGNNNSTTHTGAISGAGSLTKAGAGTMSARSVKVGGAVNVNGGTLEIAPNGTASGMIETSNLTVAGGALLAMNDNDFIVNYATGGPSPEFALRDKVKAIYQGGTSGISYTPGAGDVAIAVAERTEWGFSEFNGVALDTTAVVGKYTYFGDANLDGKVTSDDYVAVDVGLGTGDSWVQGDFNFSGTVTSDDYVAIDVNLGKGSPTPLAMEELKAEMIALHTEMFGDEYVQMLARVEAEGFAALVPEPGALSLVGLGAMGLLGRRRRASR